jgi:hypothetical protein
MPRSPATRPIIVTTVVSLVAVLVLAGCSRGDAGRTAGDGGAAGGAPTGVALRKITVAGDSISIGLGAALRPVTSGQCEVKVIGEEGTGLARPDRFDWPARLTELARDFPPAVLVFSVGSNDAQDLTDRNGTVVVPFTDTAAWDAEYSKRLARSFDTFAGSNTTVVWVGHVRTKDDKVGLANRHIHALAKDVAAGRSFVQVVDLAELLQTGESSADRCLMADGLHLTVACLDEAAGALRAQLPR